MTLDPRWSIFISLFLGILGFLSGATTLITDAGLDAVTTKHLMAWIGLMMGIGNVVNAVLCGIPSKDNKTGFILKGPDKP